MEARYVECAACHETVKLHLSTFAFWCLEVHGSQQSPCGGSGWSEETNKKCLNKHREGDTEDFQETDY